jgi:predicted TIM-barrel fold metal-dependent hydrolase
MQLPKLVAIAVLVYAPGSIAADDQQGTIGEAAQALPLFDAHMHWKRPAWEPYPPQTVLSLMDANGVAMALVSSSPDEGTITLWQYAPRRIVPEMRPYNEQLGPSNWTRGEGVGDYIEDRVRQYPHEGIGEFHMHEVDPEDEPLMRRIAALAIEKQIPLHVHSGHEPVEYLYSLDPGLTIIWAHAGMSEPPGVVEEMMARYSTLYADTSYREWEILRGADGIDADWRRVLERFSDRFMVGSDTWINGQWASYDRLMATNRQWLAQLTPDTAHNIAYRNAERLFGRRIGRQLFGTR